MSDRFFVHKLFAPIKRVLPAKVVAPARRIATAVLTPFFFSARSGHFMSSLRASAVSSDGSALPWYTYPTIDFLRTRPLGHCRVLEFGGGQSTRWWAARARAVVTFEGDPGWHAQLAKTLPDNVELFLASVVDAPTCVADIEQVLAGLPSEPFDIVVVDGLWRQFLADIACRVVAPDGVIIVDNAEGYETFERYRERGLQRVDFYGHAPGVVMPHCTSIYFGQGSFLFRPDQPLVNIAARNV